jgi:hypothetical protein
MNALVVALLCQITAAGPGAPVRLELRPVPGAKASVRLTFTDRDGKALKDGIVVFESGAASPAVPAGAYFVQALGPEIFSERAFLRAGGSAEIHILPSGLVRMMAVNVPAEVRPRLFAAAFVPPEFRGTSQWEVIEAAHGMADGVPWSSFRLPTGRYALAIEHGPAMPVLVAEADVAAGREIEASAKPVECRRLSVRAVEGPTKSPVKGARLEGATFETPNRAVVALLARRAAPAGENGLLDFGLVPAESPWSVRVSAPGFRTATLKLGARFEEGRRDLALTPNQDVEVRVKGLAGRRGEARPEVALARCKMQRARSSCLPGEAQRRPLDDEGRTRFPRVDGGFHQVELRVPGVGATHETVEVARDGNAPVFVIEMTVAEWTFRGTTRLHGAGVVSARVRATEFVGGLGEGTTAETRSAADGSFELKVVSKAENKIGLGAESDEPRAVTTSMDTIPLAEGTPVVEGVALELDATGLEIAVHDARTNEPLPGCPVEITWDKESESSSKSMIRNADSEGLVREYGLAEGTVRVAVSCEKHYPKDLGQVKVVRDEMRRVDVLLEGSQDIVLAAVDEKDVPVAGAAVLILASPLSFYSGFGRVGAVATAGSTDSQGEIRLRGDRYGGRPAFVIAPGRALAMEILPALTSCDRAEDCRVPVRVRAPSGFAGLVVRNESGKPLSPQGLSFSRRGIPIPWQVLKEVLSANGLPVDAPAVPLDVRVASLLPEGGYVVTTMHLKPDAKTKKDVWTLANVGIFTIPSLERIELLDADGPPSTNAREQVFAASAAR